MKKKILYSIGSLAVTSISSIVVLSCAKTSSSNNTVELDTDEKNSDSNDFQKQKQLLSFFKNDIKLKIDADVKINGYDELNDEIKKALKVQYNLNDENLSYIDVEDSFSNFKVGNFKNIKLGIKVNNEQKSLVNLKVGQFAKMIDLTIDLEKVKEKAQEARNLNIKNNATTEDSGYLTTPAMEEDKNIIAVLADVNGDYTDFVQYSDFNEYENAKAKYSIDHNSQNQNTENGKKSSRMLYNKNIKTPILVSIRKSQYEWTSRADDDKIKNSFDYLRLAANLSTREILLNVWEDIKNYALTKINSKASGILTEIKRVTNLENTIRDSDYENILSYKEDLNEIQKNLFKDIIKKMINPLIDQLSTENISSVKRLIIELEKVPNYIEKKHNEIVKNLNSLNTQTKKFKIHNLKFFKAWKDSDLTLNVPKYDDSKKVRYSRYLLDIVTDVPKIFDTSHIDYINPLAYAIGKTFEEIIKNNLYNMPLSEKILNDSHVLYSFEKFINNLFDEFKNTKLVKTKSLDDPSQSYNGTIINYIKKLFTDFFIFNDKFIENFDKFNNIDKENKEWYNIDISNIINSYLPKAWKWIKDWEEKTKSTSSKLMKAIKDDLTNNANNKPLSIIKLNIINGDTKLYNKKINLISFFQKLPNSLFSTYVNKWKEKDNVDKIKNHYQDLIDREINDEKLLNTTIQNFWNNNLKLKISELNEKIKSKVLADTIVGKITWPLFQSAINANDLLDFTTKQIKPILEEFSPILKDFGDTLFKVIQGEGGIYSGIDVHYLSSLVLRLEWLYNKYRDLTYLSFFSISDYLPNLTKEFNQINEEILKYSKWLEPINLAFAPIRN